MKHEQITAWALDELSPQEREQIEAALRENPQIKAKAEETKSFCDLLTQELRDESLAFTSEQRSRLQTMPPASNIIVPSAASKPVRWSFASRFGPLAAAAACVAVGGYWLYPWLKPDKEQIVAAAEEEERLFRVGLPEVRQTASGSAMADPNNPLAMAAPPLGMDGNLNIGSSRRDMGRGDVNANIQAGQNSSLLATNGTDQLVAALKSSPPPAAMPQAFTRQGELAANSPSDLAKSMNMPPMPGSPAAALSLPMQSAASTPAGSGSLSLLGNTGAAGALANSGHLVPPPASKQPLVFAGSLPTTSPSPQIQMTGGSLSTPSGAANMTAGTLNALAAPQSGPMIAAAGSGSTVLGTSNSLNMSSTSTMAAGVIVGDSSLSVAGSNANASNQAATGVFEMAEGNARQRTKMLNQVDAMWEEKVPDARSTSALVAVGNAPLTINSASSELRASAPSVVAAEPAAKPSSEADAPSRQQAMKMLFSPPKTNTESYTPILENDLKDVLREPLSTFSIDVDTASYANVRRFLNQNMIPPADAVRLEELINYFPGDEEGPAAEAKEPFAARVELATCPWQPHHRLARIAIQGKQVQKGSKASNLVFLVDVSGSMNDPQKLPLVKQSLRMLAEQMGEGDRVSMVTYASGTSVVLPPTNGENRPQIIAAVDQLQANGSTNGAGGLKLAYEQAVAGFIQEGNNRVILCTDGDFNVGISDPAELEKFIAEKARSGVFLSVLGFGSGNLKDRTMETLADKGNGNYAYIDGLAEARKVLVEQMAGTLVTIAKDVKVQIEFNPAQVRAYRLIGYENRLLAKEDFNDDTKDAGEIGSGHRVVALYELVPANLPPGVEPDRIVDTLKYQTLASPTTKDLNEIKPAAATALDATASKELMTVKLRYKQPEGETSSKIELPVTDAGKTLEAASGEFQFSASVAAFGLLLRDSSYKGTLTWEAVRKLALAGKGSDKLGYRGEFLQLIDKAAGLKQTK